NDDSKYKTNAFEQYDVNLNMSEKILRQPEMFNHFNFRVFEYLSFRDFCHVGNGGFADVYSVKFNNQQYALKIYKEDKAFIQEVINSIFYGSPTFPRHLFSENIFSTTLSRRKFLSDITSPTIIPEKKLIENYCRKLCR
ncbi:3861_t:CDS:1, partial [Cetraspora pellucida]